MDLKISYSSKDIENEAIDSLIVFLPEKSDTRAAGLSSLSETQKKLINSAIKEEIFNGKTGSSLCLITGSAKPSQLLLVGIGKREELNAETLRRAAGTAGKLLSGSKLKSVGVMLTNVLSTAGGKECGQSVSEGLQLGAYDFKSYKSSMNKGPKFIKIRILDKDSISNSNAVKHGALRAVSANLARTLGNTPANDMNPGKLADEATKICKSEGLEFKVLEEKEMKKLGMGMLLGVSQGSVSPGKLIFMEYKHPEAEETLALVGKGVTFDSGGISLKPGKTMDEMKFDMCGSAAVLGTMNAVAQMRPKLNVIGVVPATENLPGGNAQRPGDIVTAYNGKKVEILNTDAEGRLILGDALSYTIEQYKPDAVVDLATLTGACVVALGNHASGALSNHKELMERVSLAGEKSGDRVWELPNFPEYGELLKGKYGDLQNIGGPSAGTITGGKFLEHFVGDTPWVHLDIAGTAWNVKYVDYHPATGATGVGVRLLIDLISEWRPLN
ncbi:MAG: leucyl aminopeptidase [Dehalococcoidia bacterium]|nr:leucyl aminopeptidase [Dehalococcoidia bacterium]